MACVKIVYADGFIAVIFVLPNKSSVVARFTKQKNNSVVNTESLSQARLRAVANRPGRRRGERFPGPRLCYFLKLTTKMLNNFWS